MQRHVILGYDVLHIDRIDLVMSSYSVSRTVGGLCRFLRMQKERLAQGGFRGHRGAQTMVVSVPPHVAAYAFRKCVASPDCEPIGQDNVVALYYTFAGHGGHAGLPRRENERNPLLWTSPLARVVCHDLRRTGVRVEDPPPAETPGQVPPTLLDEMVSALHRDHLYCYLVVDAIGDFLRAPADKIARQSFGFLRELSEETDGRFLTILAGTEEASELGQLLSGESGPPPCESRPQEAGRRLGDLRTSKYHIYSFGEAVTFH